MDPSSTRSNRLPSSQPPSQISRIPASSAVSPNAHPDEDWTKISDLSERRRIQNRIAQRNFRQKKKKQLGDAGKRALSSSPDRSRTTSVERQGLVQSSQRRSSGHRSPPSSGAPATPSWTAVPSAYSTPGTPHRVDERYTLPSQPYSYAPNADQTNFVTSAESHPGMQPGYTVADYVPSAAYTDYFQYPGQTGYYTPDPGQSGQLLAPSQYQNTNTGFYSPGGSWTQYDVQYAYPQSDYYAHMNPPMYPYDMPPEESSSDPRGEYHQQQRRST